MAPVLLPGYTFRNTIIYYITVNPLLTPPPPGGGLIYAKSIWGRLSSDERLIWEGGGAYLIQKKIMASALHEELEYKVDNLKYKTVGGHAAEDQNQIPTSSW